MPFQLFLTADAARDLEDLYRYLIDQDSMEKAEYVLGKIEKAVNSLAEFPQRGAHPKELLALGIRDYREIFFKPYRLIYRTVGSRVYIYLITDGRRDMQVFLQRRLLEG
jgi:toxin ParE1/3/4